MVSEDRGLIGYTCSYTPIQLIRAAGYKPYRILPETNAPEKAGQLMHDNLCPHVKQILNRGLSNDLPNLDGLVFINSCDAMRRLPSAWKAARPGDNIIVLELPSVINHDLLRTPHVLSFFPTDKSCGIFLPDKQAHLCHSSIPI